MLRKYNIFSILTLVFLSLNCNNNIKNTMIPNLETTENMNYNLPDSLLIYEFIANKNSEYWNENGNKSESISYGKIFYPTDSLFKVINLFGDVSGGATNNPFAINYILKNNNILESNMEGEIFRIDKIKVGAYLFYVNQFWRLGSTIYVYEGIIKGDSLIMNELDEKFSRNYYYDLILNKKEHPESMIWNKDLTQWNEANTLITLGIDKSEIQPNEYYLLAEDSFLSIDFYDLLNEKPRFLIYYKHSSGDQIEKILRIDYQNDFKEIVLAMLGGDSFTETISTEFVNDSIFKKTYIYSESNHETGQELEFSMDSVITTLKYDKSFDMKEIKKDSVRVYIKN